MLTIDIVNKIIEIISDWSVACNDSLWFLVILRLKKSYFFWILVNMLNQPNEFIWLGDLDEWLKDKLLKNDCNDFQLF